MNTVEAWLGSLPGHAIPNVRRPLIHTGNLADLLLLAGVWTDPCPFYPPGSPPLLHATTTGATALCATEPGPNRSDNKFSDQKKENMSASRATSSFDLRVGVDIFGCYAHQGGEQGSRGCHV